MKYLCLGYHCEQTWQTMNPQQRQALVDETLAYENLLREQGHYLDGKALQESRCTTTLRFDKGKVSITDGPYVETKEQLGGVMVLEASDLNHAIQLMSQLPCMRVGGSMEIRPINENITS